MDRASYPSLAVFCILPPNNENPGLLEVFRCRKRKDILQERALPATEIFLAVPPGMAYSLGDSSVRTHFG